MGQISKPDLAISINVMHALMEQLEEEWNSVGGNFEEHRQLALILGLST